MRTIFYATSVTLLIAAAACSDNTTTKDAGPGGQLCPTTLIQATASTGNEGVSSKCHVDKYICVVGYQCGNYTQQATCTCDGTSDKFACVLANGTAVQADVQQTDLAGFCAAVPPPSPDTCPTDKTTATNTACKTPGQQCYYATTGCTQQPAPTDVCQCEPNPSGDAGLSWKCDLNVCP